MLGAKVFPLVLLTRSLLLVLCECGRVLDLIRVVWQPAPFHLFSSADPCTLSPFSLPPPQACCSPSRTTELCTARTPPKAQLPVLSLPVPPGGGREEGKERSREVGS